MKTAQIAFAVQTILFLVASTALYLAGKAPIAAGIFGFTAVFGFVVLMAMLANDAGAIKSRSADDAAA